MHDPWTPLDVVAVGAVGVDTNIYLYGEDIDWRVEANFTQNIDMVGQAGSYSARGYRQLGFRTGVIGYVGEDACGQLVRSVFNEEGIDSLFFLEPLGTNRSVNLMYRDGRRKNFYDAKSAMELQPDLGLCRAMLSRARLAHFSIQNWCRYLLPLAREQGVTVACDLQDVVQADDPYRRDFVEQADYLFFSAVNFPDPRPLIEQYLRSNPLLKAVVVGMGRRGAALGTREGVQFQSPVELEEPVRDTNGAGDSLAVGFLSAHVLEGLDPQQSLLRGQIAARHACTLWGTSAGLITREQLEQALGRKGEGPVGWMGSW